MAGAGKSPRRPPARSWIDNYIELQRKFDKRIDALLKQAAEEIEAEVIRLGDKPGIGAQVRRAQLIGSQGVIHKVLAQMWASMSSTLRKGREVAVAEALLSSFDWDEILLARAFPDPKDREHMRDYLLTSANRNIEAMLRRELGEQHTLSQKVYTAKSIADGWVSRTVSQGIVNGDGANVIALKVKKMVLPNVSGGVTYAARRLARTELNDVYHAQTIDHNKNKPWNTGMRWNLSKSHPTPDMCNAYAEKDSGLGRGVFPVDGVPRKPHPQCFCYVTPETLSVEEFNSRLLAGDFDDYMQQRYGVAIAS
jgi:hypothetical protein